MKPLKPKGIPRLRIVHQQKLSSSQEDGGLAHFERIEEPYLGVEVVEVVDVCEECGVTVKNLDLHRSKVHCGQAIAVSEALPALDSQAQAPTNPLFTLLKCPVCGSMVGDLAKHMKKAKHVDMSKRRTRLVDETVSGEQVCPFCPSRWPNRAEVLMHVKRAHGNQARVEIRLAIPRELKN